MNTMAAACEPERDLGRDGCLADSAFAHHEHNPLPCRGQLVEQRFERRQRVGRTRLARRS